MRSRSAATASGSALEAAVGGAQVALEVGEPRGAGPRRRSPGRAGGASCARDVARRPARSGAAVSDSMRRRTSRSASRIAHDARRRRASVALGEAGRRRGRAAARSAASSHAGPPPSATSASTAATIAVLERRGDAAVRRDRQRELRGAPSRPAPSARGGHRQHGAGAACRPHRRRAARPACRARARRRSRPRRPAPGTRGPPRRCPGSATACGSVADSSHAAQAATLERPAAADELGAQARAQLRAQRVEVVALGEHRAALVLDAEASSAGAAGSRATSQASGGTRTPRSAASSRGDRVDERPAPRLEPRDDRRGDVGHGHELAPQLLGQRPDAAR